MENEENCIKKQHIIDAPSRNIKKCGVVERVNAEARESAAAEAQDEAIVAVVTKQGHREPKRTSSIGVSSNIKKASSTTNIVDDLGSLFEPTRNYGLGDGFQEPWLFGNKGKETMHETIDALH
nr:hypothetical protein [Tanacetum cinerariifolium]